LPEVSIGQEVYVRKLNVKREETFRYPGRIHKILPNGILLEAFFQGNKQLFPGMKLDKGDRFIESYTTDHWYNIYEIYSQPEGRLKGWYCNIATPAEISNKEIAFIDLALDLLVFPDGKQVVLDEDEFDALRLDDSRERESRKALQELQVFFKPPISFRLLEE
jgi:hypothetical protein